MRRNDDIIGTTLYPSPSAWSGKIEVDKYTGKIDGWHGKCCGFFSRPDNGATSGGTSAQGDGFVVNDESTGDPTVNRGGCPFCGSANSRG